MLLSVGRSACPLSTPPNELPNRGLSALLPGHVATVLPNFCMLVWLLALLQMTERDVGEIDHIRVWHDNSGTAGAWHLHFIELTKGSSPSLFFTCNDWLAPPACERVLRPTLADPRSCLVRKGLDQA
jgi:hypothetical protein